jgi:hypothetical protein
MDYDPEEPRPSRAAQLSKTPSWVMLGFVLGALAVYTLPRPEKNATPPPAVVVPRLVAPAPSVPPTVEQAAFFEDVFVQLSDSAVWQNELTEVAFWNAPKKAFADCYEVLRVNDKFYFRSIPHLTRPVLKEGVPPNSPLQFTVPAGVSIPPAPIEEIGPTSRSDPVLILRPPPPTPAVVAPIAPGEKPPIALPRPDGK